MHFLGKSQNELHDRFSAFSIPLSLSMLMALYYFNHNVKFLIFVVICPNSWHQIEDRCYMILNEQLTWYNALKRCQVLEEGAELLVVNTEVGFTKNYMWTGVKYTICQKKNSFFLAFFLKCPKESCVISVKRS